MTLVEEVGDLIERYQDFMFKRIDIYEVGKHVAISTPFTDRHNDGFVIYVTKLDNNMFRLTDDGEVVTDLEHSGCTLNTPKRKEILNTILLSNGVKLEGKALVVETDSEYFALRKNDLLNAMKELDGMYVLAESRTRNLFFDDVRSWLDSTEGDYRQRTKLSGSSGFDFTVDFLIAGKDSSRLVLQVLNHPDVKGLAHAIMMKGEFSYMGIEVRVMLNNQNAADEIIRNLLAVSEYHDLAVHLWTERGDITFA